MSKNFSNDRFLNVMKWYCALLFVNTCPVAVYAAKSLLNMRSENFDLIPMTMIAVPSVCIHSAVVAILCCSGWLEGHGKLHLIMLACYFVMILSALSAFIILHR